MIYDIKPLLDKSEKVLFTLMQRYNAFLDISSIQSEKLKHATSIVFLVDHAKFYILDGLADNDVDYALRVLSQKHLEYRELLFKD